ncbi:DUF3168 domain-containing protein [Candidatus Pacearchaeota archaeon]|jgi:hypothetical protein|nr:DUF3168 domain-containing protein [Candidatus Pacearchaeota archaeon]
MLIEHALKTYLEAQAGLTALLGDGKIYYETAPQDVIAPYVTLSKDFCERTKSHDGDSHLAISRIQFSIFGVEKEGGYKTCKAIAAQLKIFLHCKKGIIGDSPGVRIYSSFWDSENDNYNSSLIELDVDYVITHYE